jgi:eukaryotic-like serine/threonine-protein kinase
MKKEKTKPEPALSTVPDRGRAVRGDATIVVPSAEQRAIPGSIHPPADSYQPPSSRTGGLTSPPTTQRELIVPSGATIDSILGHVRLPPSQRIELESKVAEGGMGTIAIGIDHALDRRLAIKTLHPHLRADESTVRMFLREARLTGLLDHPHVVPLYDIGERDGDLYFAMKLVEGQTLAAIIRALPRGPLDTATLYTLLDVMTKVCDALAFAHSRGVLHCDIKPANVMVGEFGQVYVMDWGIARLMAADPSPASAQDPRRMPAPSTSATDHSVIGTPCYMSPEQARGDRAKLDPRSDVFLLGALLYEVLTRRPPYASADRSETLALAAGGVFPSPRKVAGEGAVPPELDRIIMRAMAKEPEKRYETVAAMRDDIVRFMRGGAEFPRKTFEAGAVIIREGEPGDAAYIIVEGRCDVRKDLPTGTTTLNTIGAGDVFGEMAILTEGPRTATVAATERTTVLVITAEALEQEMAALKPWMATLLKSLASRFRDIDTQHRATFAASPSPARLANQVFMHLVTWGQKDEKGCLYAKWSELAPELEAQLGFPPIALFGAIARYGLVLDVEGDRLTITDGEKLAQRLKRELT